MGQMREARTRYKGDPPRAWVRVNFENADGRGTVQKQLVADLGGVSEARISTANMRQLKLADAPDQDTNFGRADGGWVCLSVPEIGLEK